MGSILSTVLICVPLGFVAGWLVGKTVLKRTLAEQPGATANPATAKDYDPAATIKRPDGRKLLAQALDSDPENPGAEALPAGIEAGNVAISHSHFNSDVDSDLDGDFANAAVSDNSDRRSATSPSANSQTTATNNESLQSEIRALQEALTERDHVITELQSRLQDMPDLQSMAKKVTAPTQSAANEIELQELRTELSALERTSLKLSSRVHRAEALADKKTRHMISWRNRAKPLLKQCRQQRMIISELRQQLRDSCDNSVADVPLTVEIPADDLKVLRGIGPALEKRLNKQGVYCYRQIAAMTEAQLTELSQELGIGKNRTLSAEWLAQARSLLQQSDQGLLAHPDQKADSESAQQSDRDSEAGRPTQPAGALPA